MEFFGKCTPASTLNKFIPTSYSLDNDHCYNYSHMYSKIFYPIIIILLNNIFAGFLHSATHLFKLSYNISRTAVFFQIKIFHQECGDNLNLQKCQLQVTQGLVIVRKEQVSLKTFLFVFFTEFTSI